MGCKKKIKKISPAGTMKSNGDYDWKFSTFGGVTRVNITTGGDIAHLGELDQKLWTVLSCPASGLEMDPETLKAVDLDGDGKIHVNEIIATVDYLKAVLKDLSVLIEREDSLSLSQINGETGQGAKIYASAKRIIDSLSLGGERVSLSDVAASISASAASPFNGDGVITVNSAEAPALKTVLGECIACEGAVADRSGEPGVDQAHLDAFYGAAADFIAWKDSETADMLPYGADTAVAMEVCDALKEKIDDFFLRCSLAAFHPDSEAVLDVSAERMGEISAKNLAFCTEEIAAYPLAKVNAEGELPLAGINPAWSAAFEKFRTLVLDTDFPGAKVLTEPQWRAVYGKFDAFRAHLAAKAGAEVEGLGYDRLKTVLAENRKADLEKLIAEDNAAAESIEGIREVDRLLHLCRDFYTLLRNYVTFSDFYSTAVTMSSVFQAGRLYIDQRNCDLCIRVTDMAKQTAMAGASGMFLLYCDCTSKKTADKMTIVAVMTDGDINNLKVGSNAVFYDRAGNDYDAVVTKIIDNPISIRQAFWSPYRKIGDFVGGQISKMASKQESKVLEKATSDLSTAGTNLSAAAASGGAQTTSAAQPFDVAKFAGIFAMIGMALGSIGTFLGSLFSTFVSLSWYGMILSVLGLILIISGPSMVMSWLSLRKRNLAPILNANGWAVNANVIVNARFGQTLTGVAKMPAFVGNDPFAEKKMPAWKKAVIGTALILGILVGVYFCLPKNIRPFWPQPEAQTECPAQETATAESCPTVQAGSVSVGSAPAE